MTPHCPTCLTEMPSEVVHNQTHTCSCGSQWLVIKGIRGELRWLQIGVGK